MSWTAPETDGGSKLGNYTVYRQQFEAGGCSFDTALGYTSSTSLVVNTENDDQSKKNYKVWVKASNIGNRISEPSEIAQVRVLVKSTTLYIDANGKENQIAAVLNQTSKYGQKVIVREGQYNMSKVILMKTDHVALKSENGSAFTVVHLNKTRFLYVNPDENGYSLGILEGFTFKKEIGINSKDSFDYDDGGILFFKNIDHTVILRDLKFLNSHVAENTYGGVIAIASSAGPFLISHALFENNYVTGKNAGGGAIAIMEGVRLNMDKVIFKNNNAVNSAKGGALYASNMYDGVNGKRPLVDMEETVFLNNMASRSNGGAIFVLETDLKVTKCSYKQNQAEKGGVMFLRRSSLKGQKVSIVNNLAVDGGVVYAGGSTMEFLNSNFSQNIAMSGNGGALAAVFSVIALKHVKLNDNEATKGNGGAISLGLESSFSLESSVIENNIAKAGSGGGIYALEVEVFEIKNTNISSCTALIGGGVTISKSASSVIVDTSFTGCEATGNVGGGGMNIFDCSQIEMACVMFVENKALNGGGGSVFWDYPKPTMSSASLQSPLLFRSCNADMETIDHFSSNQALYGNDVASGPYALIQSGGPCKEPEPKFVSSDSVFGSQQSFQTSQNEEDGGEILGGMYANKNYPAFIFLDYYANIVNAASNDVVTIETSATHLLMEENSDNLTTHSREYGSLLSQPAFSGSLKAAVQSGRAEFYQLKLKGIPGETYTGNVISTRVDRILTTFQIKLRRCVPGEKIEDAEPVCALCPAGKFSQTVNSFDCQTCLKGTYSLDGASECTNCSVGKYQDTTGNFACKDCQINTFTNASGMHSCTLCKPGFYQDELGFSFCNMCMAGKFRDATSIQCNNCPQGKSTNNVGGGECLPCKKGRYSDKEGANECKACISGKVAREDGTSVCEICSVGLDTATQSEASECTNCPTGKYGRVSIDSGGQCYACDANSVASNPGSDLCIACPDHTWTKLKEGGTACEHCKLGEIFDADRNCNRCLPGKYSLTAGEKKDSCHECPEGAACLGGATILPKSNWWMSNGTTPKNGECDQYNATNPPRRCGVNEMKCANVENKQGAFINACNKQQRLYKCALERGESELPICNPLPLSNRTLIGSQCLCTDSECYTGKMCETCAKGYAKFGRYACRKCFDASMTVVAFILTIIGLMACMSFYITIMMQSVGLSDVSSSGIKIIMNTIQLASLGAGFPLQWPKEIMSMFSSFGFVSSASDQVLQLDCLMQNFDFVLPIIYQKTIFMAFLPIISVGICLSVMKVSHTCTRTSKAKSIYDLHKQMTEEDHLEDERFRQDKNNKQESIIKKLQLIEKRLNYQYDYYIREDNTKQYVPPLNKYAIAVLRSALSRASRKGIDVIKSIDNFEFIDSNTKKKMMDVRRVTEMLNDFEVGLTEEDLIIIQKHLNKAGNGTIHRDNLLQYHHKLYDKCILAASVIWYLEYPLLCKAPMSLLGCRHDLFDGDHQSYLRLDYEVPCYDTAHVTMVVVIVIPMVILYIIGLPMLTLLAIKLHGEKGKSSDKVRYRYGMFTDGYRNTHVWWETIVALRKAIVICISVFLSTYGALVQAYVGVLVVGVFLTLQMAQKPYLKPVLNNLETFGMGACLVTLYAGMLFFNRFLACPNNTTYCPLMHFTEAIVIGTNATFIVYAFAKLSLEYALDVTESKLFMRFIIWYFKQVGRCFALSASNRKQLEMLEKKLQRSAQKGVTEVLFVQKFKRISSKSRSKKNLKTGTTKVSPKIREHDTRRKAKEFWWNEDDFWENEDEFGENEDVVVHSNNTIML